MNSNRRPGMLTGMAVLFSIGLAPVLGFETQGLRWRDGNVAVALNQDIPAVAEAPVRNALAAWSSVPGSSFLFRYAGFTTVRWTANDGVNAIYALNKGKDDGRVAVTYTWFQPSTKEILDCDIEANTYYPWSVDGAQGTFDAQNAATHELGHMLRLDDLYGPADVNKTMYGFIALGETKKRTLDLDDMNGVKGLYPR